MGGSGLWARRGLQWKFVDDHTWTYGKYKGYVMHLNELLRPWRVVVVATDRTGFLFENTYKSKGKALLALKSKEREFVIKAAAEQLGVR